MLTRITSSDNGKLRLVRKLGTRKGRSEEKRFVAEGRNLVTGILERGMTADMILVPESLREDRSDAAAMIRKCAKSKDVLVCELPDRLFQKLTDGGNGIDMLAVVRMRDAGAGLLSGLEAADNILVLDRIQDPGNMGTLIRTAVASGYKAVLAMSGSADIYSPKVLRATAGMVFDIPVIYIGDYDELADVLKRSGKRAAVTSVDGGRPYYEEDLREGIALIIGNEGNGVSDRVMEMADIKVTIPMKGGVESLNAAVAASILMYEAVRGSR